MLSKQIYLDVRAVASAQFSRLEANGNPSSLKVTAIVSASPIFFCRSIESHPNVALP
jgi:hypothetical protein